MATVLLGFVSCSIFESKDKKTQRLVDEELQQIDWNDVDNYPLFDNCDETAIKVAQKSCFEQRILAHLSHDLQVFKWESESDIDDVIFLDFMVDSTGDVAIIDIQNKEILGEQMEQFSNKIGESLKRLPHVEPALKRGIPVRAKFRIPIFINSKE